MKNMRKIKVLLILLILPVLNGRAFTEKELVADGQEKNRTQERSGVPSTGDVDVAEFGDRCFASRCSYTVYYVWCLF